jgi:hypothetical protein
MRETRACCENKLQSFSNGGLQREVNNIEQYVCPFCLQADALFKVWEDGESIEGWGCHRCKSVQLRDAEYADGPPPKVALARTPTGP